ncbi:MAG: DUF5060 domain-containing protein [Bacteroidota bacterium]
MNNRILFFALLLFFAACNTETPYELSGELKEWHKITLTFDGPTLEEISEDNPFMDYRLEVLFEQDGKTFLVPGYFAADGNAGETSATSGNKWKAHFAPDAAGTWTFKTSFRKGKDIAISTDKSAGEALELDGTEGNFEVVKTDKSGKDFRAQGRIVVNRDNQYFQHLGSQKYFLKAGADSPENFLAYYEFDSTYRHPGEARKGESDPTENLHFYPTHEADWKAGDPTWKEGKGKAIIGALNYLESKDMNAVYFLTMNIGGDGKDVWPYTNHEERFRFDCSKLDQWEVVFEHMERLGLMMHVVTQETENEKLLDDGNTERERKIYYRELIARFGHHNALEWNLGEENGPAPFSPNGQDTEQRKAMTKYLKATDPYQHPVVLHTHAWSGHKDEILTDLLGFEPLDGLSFQVDKRAQVHDEIVKWDSLSEAANHPWQISMDEIGFWHTGVMPDEVNPKHDTIRHEVLWGALMAGGAGVEWYFGGLYPHNDLACEDWRSRKNMWEQTDYAIDFFQEHLPFWEMKSVDELVNEKTAYCFAKEGETYALYFPIGSSDIRKIDLGEANGNYAVKWFNPRTGGDLMEGTVAEIKGEGWQPIGLPKTEVDQDWVALVVKK